MKPAVPFADPRLPGRTDPPARSSRARLVLELAGCALLALVTAMIAERGLRLLPDLRTYQAAARVALGGGDPYLPEALSAAAGRPVFPWVYPPVALAPFFPLAGVPFPLLAAGWMGAKLAVLAGLVFGWTRLMAFRRAWLAVALVAVFGANASALWDLGSGNVALFECALVWAGLFCFVGGHRTAFALFIVAAACFKLAPAAFLLLLLVPTDRAPSPARLVVALALLAALVLLPGWIGPAAHFAPFWSALPDAAERGNANPSLIALATTLLRSAGVPESTLPAAARAFWLAFAAGLLALSLPRLKEAWRARDARTWVMLATFLFVLLHPRPMAYGYVLLAPAPLFFRPRPFDRPGGRELLALVLAAQGLWWRLTSNTSDSPLVVHAPFLLSLCVWLLLASGRPREVEVGAGVHAPGPDGGGAEGSRAA